MQSCELDNWKEALAALLTYAHPEDFARLCGKSLRRSHRSCSFASRRTLAYHQYLFHLLDIFFICVILSFFVGRHSGRPAGARENREALPSGLFVLHLLWEHWEAGGVLGLAQRQLIPSWSGGIIFAMFGLCLCMVKKCFNCIVASMSETCGRSRIFMCYT